jgi:uncharacterized protein YbjT (DUF2867 family)
MKILLFGSSGSAGGGVLSACFSAPLVEEVRAIVRRPLVRTTPKLRTYLHADFLDFSPLGEAFDSVDACLFCLGMSVTQVSKGEYHTITHDYSLAAARMLQQRSPHAAFHYVSGQGTSPASRMFWSRVKARTELELIKLVGAVCWRPAFIDAPPSKSLPKIYALFFPLMRLLKPFPRLYVAGDDLGRAMLQGDHRKYSRSHHRKRGNPRPCRAIPRLARSLQFVLHRAKMSRAMAAARRTIRLSDGPCG